MRFGSMEIPGSIFKLARDRMLRDATFTPEEIRRHLMEQAPVILNEISSIGVNHRIIADRVMRDCIKQLVASGEIAQLKRGFWSKSSNQRPAKSEKAEPYAWEVCQGGRTFFMSAEEFKGKSYDPYYCQPLFL